MQDILAELNPISCSLKPFPSRYFKTITAEPVPFVDEEKIDLVADKFDQLANKIDVLANKIEQQEQKLDRLLEVMEKYIKLNRLDIICFSVQNGTSVRKIVH